MKVAITWPPLHMRRAKRLVREYAIGFGCVVLMCALVGGMVALGWTP